MCQAALLRDLVALRGRAYRHTSLRRIEDGTGAARGALQELGNHRGLPLHGSV